MRNSSYESSLAKILEKEDVDRISISLREGRLPDEVLAALTDKHNREIIEKACLKPSKILPKLSEELNRAGVLCSRVISGILIGPYKEKFKSTYSKYYSPGLGLDNFLARLLVGYASIRLFEKQIQK